MAPVAEAFFQRRQAEMGKTADPTSDPISRYTYL